MRKEQQAELQKRMGEMAAREAGLTDGQKVMISQSSATYFTQSLQTYIRATIRSLFATSTLGKPLTAAALLPTNVLVSSYLSFNDKNLNANAFSASLPPRQLTSGRQASRETGP